MWDLVGGQYLTIVIIIAVLAFVMCGCVMAFIRSLIRRRRQTKEQNATARDVPAMSREMSALVLAEPGPPRAPETSDVADIAVLVADQESEGQASQDASDAAAPPRSDSDASASFSTPPPAANEWTCERCTFTNGYNSAACEMCGASGLARPISLAHPSADPLDRSGSHALNATGAPPAAPPPGGLRKSPRLVDDEGNPVSDSDENEVGSAGASPTTPQDAPLSPARPKQSVSL